MSTFNLLKVQPSELKFPFEVKKQSSCSMQLTNKTEEYVAFKVKTTNPKKYCVRPNTGVIVPGTSCEVLITMQAQKDAPPDLQCKDKFLLQNVVVENGLTNKDITAEMFNKAPDRVVEEIKLRVIYIPANPPSPVPEESEEGSPPRSSVVDDEAHSSPLLDVSRSFEEPSKENASEVNASEVSRSYEEPAKENSSEASALISKLTEEKDIVLQENQQLNKELAMLRTAGKQGSGGFSIMVLVLVGLLSAILGYIMKRP